MRLALFPKPVQGRLGLDLLLLEPEASVGDLVDAFQPYAGLEGGIYKRHLRGSGLCRGCVQNCCTTSIVIPDPIGFTTTARRLGLSDGDLLMRHCDPCGLEAGLVRFRSQPCTFLASDGTCSVYAERGLICRSFICCPYSDDLQDLVHNLLGAGLAALTGRLRKAGLLPHPDRAALLSLIHQGEYDAEFGRFVRRWILREITPDEEVPPAWVRNPFETAESYRDLPLAAFATSDGLRRLIRAAQVPSVDASLRMC